MKQNFSSALGDAVKQARHERNLTQANLADQVGVEPRTILNIENYYANPKMQVLYPLIRALQIDPWVIFYPEMQHRNKSFRQLQILLMECTDEEIESLLQVCRSVLSFLKAKDSIQIESSK